MKRKYPSLINFRRSNPRCAALPTGFMGAYFSKNFHWFHGTVYIDYTQYNELEEFDINGRYALYLKAGNSVNIRGLLVRDGGDYGLQILGNLSKD